LNLREWLADKERFIQRAKEVKKELQTVKEESGKIPGLLRKLEENKDNAIEKQDQIGLWVTERLSRILRRPNK